MGRDLVAAALHVPDDLDQGERVGVGERNCLRLLLDAVAPAMFPDLVDAAQAVVQLVVLAGRPAPAAAPTAAAAVAIAVDVDAGAGMAAAGGAGTRGAAAREGGRERR